MYVVNISIINMLNQNPVGTYVVMELRFFHSGLMVSNSITFVWSCSSSSNHGFLRGKRQLNSRNLA